MAVIVIHAFSSTEFIFEKKRTKHRTISQLLHTKDREEANRIARDNLTHSNTTVIRFRHYCDTTV